MRKSILPLLFLGLLNKGFSQNFSCGADKMAAILKENTKDYDEQIKKNNLQIKDYIDTHFASGLQGRPTNTVYTIPVVFHVIHPTGQAYGTGSNLSYLQLQSQIDALNAAFGKNYPAYNGQTHASYAQNTNIKFCLARLPAPATATFYTGTSGIEYGVRRYADNAATVHQMGIAGATALLNLTHPNTSYFPFSNYLNIWIVSNILSGSAGITMGYATLPVGTPLDGIVMRADVTGDNTTGNSFSLGYGLTQGKVMVHEAGHYFNLQHIFQGGCAGANALGSAIDACDLNGDYICDIEPCTTQNISCTQPIPNTCTANYLTGTTTMDMIESYMSYADDDCMNTFTMNQAQRIWATLNTSRWSLWQISNLGATGVSGPNGCNPAILLTNINVSGNCTNSVIAVTNQTVGNTASSWTWTAPGGNITGANTTAASITYATPGLKTVKLIASNGNTFLLDSAVISVTNCSLDPNKLNRSNWLFGDQASVSFANGQPAPNNVAVVNNTIKCFENAMSISDSLGNLLFYSNGRNLWKNNHTLVNSSPLLGWDLISSGYNGSSVGGFMSFPFPKKPNKHFIVCVPPTEIKGSTSQGQFAKINYVVYDALSQTVTPFQSLTSPLINYTYAYPNFGLTENLNVVPHCNGIDYWIIARGTNVAGTGFYFYSFLVNTNGLSPTTTPVLSNLFPLAYVTQTSDMKSNAAGNKLVCKGQNKNTGYIWDFDQSTGVVSNPIALMSSATATTSLGVSGIIFSPNSQYIYSAVSTSNTPNVDMIDAASNTLVKTIIPVGGSVSDAYFEIGPDNIIYSSGWSNSTGFSLSQLTNPNSAANSTVSTYVNFASVPNGKPNSTSLLNFMEAQKPAESQPILTPVAISCSTYSFSMDPCWKVYSPSWNFGDGSPAATASNVTHVYANPGTYTVSLTLSFNGTPIPAYTRTITIFSAGNVSITGPTVICVGSPYLNSYGVTQFPNANYLWSASNATIAGPANVANVSAAGGVAGIATLSVQVNNGGCTVNATKTVNVVNFQVNLAVTATAACAGQNVTLTGSPAGGSYTGTTNGNIFNTSLTGTYNVSYNYNNSGCYKSAGQSIQVYKCTGLRTFTGENWEVYLYPNPNSGLLYVNSSLPINSFEINNALGQSIMQGIYGDGINTEALRDGIYFISVKNAVGEKVKLKFVKE